MLLQSGTTAVGGFGRPLNGMSYVEGATDVPLSQKTIPQLLKDTVSSYGHHEAVIFPELNIRWTWQQFSDQIDLLAVGLKSLGLTKGDRVGIWSPNRPEWLLTQFATARLGVILVSINPAYRTSELEYALNLVGCKALVVAERFKKNRLFVNYSRSGA